jgi:hypothetical protein
MGRGNYQYKDMTGLVQEIRMNELRIDEQRTTTGSGVITEKQQFLLSPQFAFAGDVSLNARSSYLGFSGGYRMIQNCMEEDMDYWVAFNSIVDPNRISLPIDDTIVDISGAELQSGIFFSTVFDNVYPAVLKKKKVLSDTALFAANGRVVFDSTANRFIIAPVRRFENEFSGDNMMILDNRRCGLYGSGTIVPPVNYGNYLTVEAYGDIEYLIIPDSTKMNTTLLIDFIFFDGALKMMTDSITSANLRGLDLMSDEYTKTLSYILGYAGVQAMRSDIGLTGNVRKVPEPLQKTLFLTDVKLYWNSEIRSFVSKGQFGVGTIGQDQVNRMVDGYVELVKKRSGDELNIYIEAGPKTWYFFNFRGNIMQAISSDMEFNNRLSDLKSDKRIFKVDGEEEPYEFVLSSRRKRIDFLRKMDEYNK